MVAFVNVLALLVLYFDTTFGQRHLYGPCSSLPSTPCAARQGVVVIGGFFPIHEWNHTNSSCSSTIRPGSGLQRLAAAQWAMENLDSRLMFPVGSNLELGYDLRDSCSSETYLRDSALQFINIGTRCVVELANKPISMVLGASSSSLSVDLTNLLTLFRVPHVSYSATSDRLNDSTSLFYRTVPPDNFQARAMISVMARFNWSYVSLVYSDDAYGLEAKRVLESREKGRVADGFQYCLAASVALSTPASESTINDSLNQVILNSDNVWHDNATVVVLFMSAEMAQQFLEAAVARPDIHSRRLTFIASDSLSGDVYSLRNLNISDSIGLVTFEPKLSDDSKVQEFLTFFENQTRADFPQLPWYTEYFQALFPDCANFNSVPCSTYQVSSSQFYRADTKIASVIRAADIAMRAIALAVTAKCGNVTNCSGILTSVGSVNGVNIAETIVNVTFGSGAANISYQSASRSFLNGAEPYQYTIRNVVRSNSSVNATGRLIEFEEIGRWSPSEGLVLSKLPVFAHGSDPRPSHCALECGVGQFRALLRTDSQCCWSCRPCPAHHFAATTDVTSCSRCPSSQRANTDKTGCLNLEETYVGFSSPLGALCSTLASLGIIATAVIAVVFYKNITTPLVIASSRELSSCLFAGFLVAYLSIFAFFSRPSAATCGIQRIGLGFSLSICFSALLVKTNRISRIFNRKIGVGRPRYTTPGFQLVFTLILVLVEVAILCAWLGVEPPMPLRSVAERNEELLLLCQHSDSVGLLGSLAYNLLLLGTCTYYGIKTRKIPENFNEAKYINFSTYTILAVCLSFIPAYLTVRSDLRPAMLVLPLVLVTSCMLAFLFFPKAFIIVFHPERNVRSTARRKSRDYGRKRSTGLNASAINKSGSAGRDTPLSSPTSQGRIGVLSSGGDASYLDPQSTPVARQRPACRKTNSTGSEVLGVSLSRSESQTTNVLGGESS